VRAEGRYLKVSMMRKRDVGGLVTRVYLVRHGQTEWNKNLIFRGRIDIPLNEKGHREAEAIAEALKDRNIDAIYTSPLGRSIETARPTAEFFDLEIVCVPGLIDISYGDWEGLSFNEVKKRYKNQYTKWEKRPDLVRFPKGETLNEVRGRSFCAMKDIVKENPGKSVLIIPHRVINKVLLCAILGIGNSHFWEIKQDTGCINLIEYSSDAFVLSLMNDTCHLKAIADGTSQPDF
jgi:broad specificity phosphatase PhoE